MRHNTPSRKQPAKQDSKNPYRHTSGESWQDRRGNWHYVESPTNGQDNASTPIGAKVALLFFLFVLVLWFGGAFAAISTF